MSFNRSNRSMVWEFFKKSKVKDSEKFMVICQLCSSELKYFGNTSNLSDHLKRKHIGEWNRVKSKDNSDNSEEVPSSSAPTPSVKRSSQMKFCIPSNKRIRELSESEKQSLDKSLMKMVAADLQPLSIVEDSGFREFVKMLRPEYCLPSRKVLSTKLLPASYVEITEKLRAMLDKMAYVSITTDIWSSDSNKSFLTVTVHFILCAVLYSPVLCTTEIAESHTGAVIGSNLRDIAVQWGILHKIVTVVSDNGANVKNAIQEHLKMRHHPCVAHTLNLCVQDAIKDNTDLADVLKKCRRIVGHFKHSVAATEKLREMQEVMNMPQLKVKQDVVTRWNSALLMMERLEEIKSPLTVVISLLPNCPENLDASEWEIITDCVKILKPVEMMTQELSGEKYPTMGIVIPLVRGLQAVLKKHQATTQIGHQLLTRLQENLTRRLTILETNKICCIATILDARLKKQAFGLQQNADNAEKYLLEELTVVIRKEEENKVQNPDIQETADVENEKPNSLWSNFDQKVSQKKASQVSGTSAILLVRQYLEKEILPRSTNILQFWDNHKEENKQLYQLHQKYHSIPATSVPSERVFSKAGLITNDRRNRLLGKNLNMLIFLNANGNI